MSKQIGAMWFKKTKNGNKYLSLSLEIGGKKYNLVAFKNENKEQMNQPDWKIYSLRRSK